MMDLTEITNPSFIKKLIRNRWRNLQKKFGQFLIEKLSVTGGHIGPNLGVVELTIALHRHFQ